jgi:hypothetical protein
MGRWAKTKERLHRRAMAGVAGRRRKMLEQAAAAVCIGTVTFEGPAFGGRHTIRCLMADGYSETRMMLEIDGRQRKARTVRGMVRMVCARVMKTEGSGK